MTIELVTLDTTSSVSARGRRNSAQLSELVFVDRLQTQLRRKWSVARLGREVRAHGRARIDLVVEVVGEDGLALVAIEAKLSNARRAVHQALLNRFAADLSYVALPASAVTAFALHFASVNGVGVLSVDRDGVDVVAKATVGKPDPVLKMKISSALLKVRPLRIESQDPERRGR